MPFIIIEPLTPWTVPELHALQYPWTCQLFCLKISWYLDCLMRGNFHQYMQYREKGVLKHDVMTSSLSGSVNYMPDISASTQLFLYIHIYSLVSSHCSSTQFELFNGIWDPTEPWGNQLDTMSQILPVRGVRANFFFFFGGGGGGLGHYRGQRRAKQIRSWTFILNG